LSTDVTPTIDNVERGRQHALMLTEVANTRAQCRTYCAVSQTTAECQCEARCRDIYGELLIDLEPLLRWVVRPHVDWNNEFDDLMQFARIHALRALESWKPNAGATAASWVVMYLRFELAKERRRQHRARAHASSLVPGLDPASPDHVNEPTNLGQSITMLLQRLDDADADLVRDLLAGSSLRTPWERGRARALVAHPASGVAQTYVDGEPTPRPSTIINAENDATALATSKCPQSGWELLAPCVNIPLSEVMPRRGEALSERLRNLCESCPVRLDCLAVGCSAATWPGTWGGHSLKARTRIRSRLRSKHEPDSRLIPGHESS
jgi:DNA-directed RNA polymerase specialized sigma24 family protein